MGCTGNGPQDPKITKNYFDNIFINFRLISMFFGKNFHFKNYEYLRSNVKLRLLFLVMQVRSSIFGFFDKNRIQWTARSISKTTSWPSTSFRHPLHIYIHRMHTYIYIHTSHACIYIYIHACMYSYIRDMHSYIACYIYIHMHAFTSTCMSLFVCCSSAKLLKCDS